MSIGALGTYCSDTAVDTDQHACGRYVKDDVSGAAVPIRTGRRSKSTDCRRCF